MTLPELIAERVAAQIRHDKTLAALDLAVAAEGQAAKELAAVQDALNREVTSEIARQVAAARVAG